MDKRLGLILCSLAASAGCSGSSGNVSTSAQNEAASSASPVAGPSGEERFRQLSECSATLGQMAILYEGIAAEHGSDAAEMAQRASARHTSAGAFELDASTEGRRIGKTQDDIDRIKAGRRAEIERERRRQPDFGEFAIWLGHEADRCAALDPLAG